jgi:hypothetical protein
MNMLDAAGADVADRDDVRGAGSPGRKTSMAPSTMT